MKYLQYNDERASAKLRCFFFIIYLFIYLFFNEEYIPEILTGLKSIHPGYYPD